MTSTDIVPLSGEQLDVVDYCEQYWHKYSDFPVLTDLKVEFPKLDIQKVLAHPTFILSMNNRGIKLPKGDKIPDRLTKEQVAAALKFLDMEDKRSLGTKLKEIGVTTTQWYGWMKNPVFKDFVLDNSARDFEENLHEAQMGLRKAMERGETHAIKFYYELTNRYNGAQGNIGNLRVVLAQVIEAVQRHVKDPDTLRAIGQDFETILTGGGTKAPEVIEQGPDILRLL